MAFGKNKEESPAPAADGGAGRRYVSKHLPIVVSGKGLLQGELDRGASQGWNLHTVFHVEKNNFIMVVWEIPPTAQAAPTAGSVV